MSRRKAPFSRACAELSAVASSSVMWTSSYSPTPGCCSGRLRMTFVHTSAQAVPTPPRIQNTWRQPRVAAIQAISGKATPRPMNCPEV